MSYSESERSQLADNARAGGRQAADIVWGLLAKLDEVTRQRDVESNGRAQAVGERYDLYKALDKYGIRIDQVDRDSEGYLWRYILGPEGDLRSSPVQFRSAAQALDAALAVLFGEVEP